MVVIPSDDASAAELVLAVRTGAIDSIRRLLSEHPELANARLGSSDDGTRTPLHVVTDWPGYFPHGPEIVRLLIDAGAYPNVVTTGRGEVPSAVTTGRGSETPLHWAASSDDADVARALIDGGADLETPGGSIGTPPQRRPACQITTAQARCWRRVAMGR